MEMNEESRLDEAASGPAPLLQSTEDVSVPDSAEKVLISPLALIKMLKHGRTGVPLEVMGLLLGNFEDEYTVSVVDISAIPQIGTDVKRDAGDPDFLTKMSDMLARTGRNEPIVGWYHSHPGLDCWLSRTDRDTHRDFQALSKRAVAVVFDPVQSVKGKVLIDAFRMFDQKCLQSGICPRQHTSNLSHLKTPSPRALSHGLNRYYYSLPIDYKMNDLERQMLMKMTEKPWEVNMASAGVKQHCATDENTMKKMVQLAENYNKSLVDLEKMTPKELERTNFGKPDHKRNIEEKADELLDEAIAQMVQNLVMIGIFK